MHWITHPFRALFLYESILWCPLLPLWINSLMPSCCELRQPATVPPLIKTICKKILNSGSKMTFLFISLTDLIWHKFKEILVCTWIDLGINYSLLSKHITMHFMSWCFGSLLFSIFACWVFHQNAYVLYYHLNSMTLPHLQCKVCLLMSVLPSSFLQS